MSQNIPKVAVVTRTKDRALLLERAIISVHSQTMTDFIHVIINDGGDKQPVDALVKRHEQLIAGRIKVIHNEASGGMEAASNKAIKSVKSTFIAIHDDDDSWHQECLARAVKHLEDAAAAGVTVRTNKITEEIGEDGRSVTQLKSEPWMPDMSVINLYRQCIDNQMTPITFIYRRKILDEIGYYDEDLPVCGDWEFGIRFLTKHDVEFLDPGFALAFYHHRKFAAGSAASSNFGSGTGKHRYYTNKIMNRYLRQELAEGRLGVGYMMSKLKYEQGYTASIVKKLLPGFLVNKLKNRIRN